MAGAEVGIWLDNGEASIVVMPKGWVTSSCSLLSVHLCGLIENLALHMELGERKPTHPAPESLEICVIASLVEN